MATKNDPNKDALTKNRSDIIKKLANPEKVADYLYSIKLFDNDMRLEVMQEPEREKKTRIILDTLNYRGLNAAEGLYYAFLYSNNEELVELLAPYIRTIESEDNTCILKVWPPSDDDQKKMEEHPVMPYCGSLHFFSKSSNIVYKMRNIIRGTVFIINNEKFEKKTKLSLRKGSDVDAKNLESLFKQLHFEVVTTKDQSAKGMIDFLINERDKVNWYDMECVVLIIMSHGGTDGIYGTDGELKKLKDMTDIFISSQCSGLNGKPRLVFVQACRGTNIETGIQGTDGGNQKDEAVGAMKDMTLTDKDGQDTHDAVPVNEIIHSAADFLIAYATPEGTPAYRNIESGSWFLNAIVWTFKYHACNEDIHHLLTRVNRLVSKGRGSRGEMTVSEVKHSLTKEFFFFPGKWM